jgi:hypothetical protein
MYIFKSWRYYSPTSGFSPKITTFTPFFIVERGGSLTSSTIHLSISRFGLILAWCLGGSFSSSSELNFNPPNLFTHLR